MSAADALPFILVSFAAWSVVVWIAAMYLDYRRSRSGPASRAVQHRRSSSVLQQRRWGQWAVFGVNRAYHGSPEPKPIKPKALPTWSDYEAEWKMTQQAQPDSEFLRRALGLPAREEDK